MKNIKFAVAAIALSTLSFGVFAAEPVTSTQAQSMNKWVWYLLMAPPRWTAWKQNWLKKQLLLVQVVTASPPLSATTK